MNTKKLFTIASALILILVLGMCRQQAVAQHDDDEGPLSNLRFLVVKDYNGKPIRNAGVVLHPVKKNGQQSLGGMELKTDNDGRTHIDGIPYGPLRVQVLAPGFQTFGEDYQIDKPELEITIKLKRPGGQYSSDNPAGAKPDDKNQSPPKPQ